MVTRTVDAAPQSCFVTGTSSGFGRRLTEQLLGRGDRVRVAPTVRREDAPDRSAWQMLQRWRFS
jgi:NAD(P)-dependent dehydrogenase (short-subunit alcohol dehydrogenase family)